MIKLKDNPVEGKQINMGGMTLIMPALNLKKLKEQADVILAMDQAKTAVEQLSIASGVVHSALQRNYPEITLEEVEELLDMTNMQAVISAVLGQDAPGERMPA
jgi:hypothetical protein